MKTRLLVSLLSVLVVAGFSSTEPQTNCPQHEQHTAAGAADSKFDAMQQRGNLGMGFDQSKTRHHFRLTPNGGVIEVLANSNIDSVSISQIRKHLGHIAGAIASGDFDVPMFVHGQTPDGVSEMQKFKDQIQYRYVPSSLGGKVILRSANPDAVHAMHSFLRYQITQHHTGDSLATK